MIQILTLIRFAFPFLLLTAFFCLYRKEYGFMKRFMWKMAMFQSARNLYAYLVVLMLIFINWCCHVTAPNLSVVVSTLLTLVLLNRKIAESTFHLLHERKRLWFRHLAALDGLLRLTLYEQHVFVPLYRQRGSSLLSIWKSAQHEEPS